MNIKKIKLNDNQLRILTEVLTEKMLELKYLIGNEEVEGLNVSGKQYEILTNEYDDVVDLLNKLVK